MSFLCSYCFPSQLHKHPTAGHMTRLISSLSHHASDACVTDTAVDGEILKGGKIKLIFRPPNRPAWERALQSQRRTRPVVQVFRVMEEDPPARLAMTAASPGVVMNREPSSQMKATPLLERLPRFIQGEKKVLACSRCGFRTFALCRTRGRGETTRAPAKAKRNVAALRGGQTANYLSCLFLHPAAQPATLLHQDQTRDQTQRHEYLISCTPPFFHFFFPRLHFCKVVSLQFFFCFCFSYQRSRFEVWLLAAGLSVTGGA